MIFESRYTKILERNNRELENKVRKLEYDLNEMKKKSCDYMLMKSYSHSLRTEETQTCMLLGRLAELEEENRRLKGNETHEKG